MVVRRRRIKKDISHFNFIVNPVGGGTTGVIHCCWLTAVIHYFSSEFEGQVSGVRCQEDERKS
jgi:hypothetical protein